MQISGPNPGGAHAGAVVYTMAESQARDLNAEKYEDFFICSIDETKRLVDGASKFLSIIKMYLEGQYLQLDHLQDIQNAIVDENMNADEYVSSKKRLVTYRIDGFGHSPTLFGFHAIN